MGIVSSKWKFDLEDIEEKILRQVTRSLSGRTMRFRNYEEIMDIIMDIMEIMDIISGLQGREGLKET